MTHKVYVGINIIFGAPFFRLEFPIESSLLLHAASLSLPPSLWATMVLGTDARRRKYRKGGKAPPPGDGGDDVPQPVVPPKRGRKKKNRFWEQRQNVQAKRKKDVDEEEEEANTKEAGVADEEETQFRKSVVCVYSRCRSKNTGIHLDWMGSFEKKKYMTKSRTHSLQG